MNLDRRQQMEKILVDIYYHADKPHKYYRQEVDENIYNFNGRLGGLISYHGNFWERGSFEKSGVTVDLQYRNEKLARIETEHGFIQPGSMPFWTDMYGFDMLANAPKPIASATEIKVISPRWTEKDGVCDLVNSEFMDGKLTVAHAADEGASEVLENVYRAVVHSKDQKVIVETLKTLRLPSGTMIKNFDQLADVIMENIYPHEHVQQKVSDVNETVETKSAAIKLSNLKLSKDIKLKNQDQFADRIMSDDLVK